MKSERDFIKYLTTMTFNQKNVIKGIGDDCSILKFKNDKKYVLTTDTSLLGPHFTKDYTPEEIGYKTLASNISDIASMGCKPMYAMYAITLPKISSRWIKEFFKGTNKLLKKHDISIIGGDTTKGPLSITIQLIGIEVNKIICRSGAKCKDDIYVTGSIGGARAALISNKNSLAYKYFEKDLKRPQPRVQIGIDLSKYINSCIDISDGIVKDLRCIADDSSKGFIVDVDSIPVKPKFHNYVPRDKIEECLLGGGEDYELCFTAPASCNKNIYNISKKHNTKITKIGVITPKKHIYVSNDVQIKLSSKGYDHFTH